MKKKLLRKMASASLVTAIALTPIATSVTSVGAATTSSTLSSAVKSVEALEKLNSTLRAALINYVNKGTAVSSSTITQYNSAIASAKKSVNAVTSTSEKSKLNTRIANASKMVSYYEIAKKLVSFKSSVTSTMTKYNAALPKLSTLSSGTVSAVVKVGTEIETAVKTITDTSLKSAFSAQVSAQKSKVGPAVTYVKAQTAGLAIASAQAELKENFDLEDMENTMEYYQTFIDTINKNAKVFSSTDSVTAKFKAKYYTPALIYRDGFKEINSVYTVYSTLVSSYDSQESLDIQRANFENTLNAVNSLKDKTTKAYFIDSLVNMFGESEYSEFGYETDSLDTEGLSVDIRNISISGNTYKVTYVETNYNDDDVEGSTIKFYGSNGAAYVVQGSGTVPAGESVKSVATFTTTGSEDIEFFEYGSNLQANTKVTIYSLLFEMKSYHNADDSEDEEITDEDNTDNELGDGGDWGI